MSPTRVLVLGAGYAGLLAALRLARRAGPRAAVTLVDARDAFVERIRLHQLAAGQALVRRPYAAWLEGTGVAFCRGRVLALDPERREARLDTGALAYDVLVMALGSRTDTSIPGAREHAHALDGPGSAARAAQALEGAGRVVVVGGGLTGIEAAAEIAQARPRAKVRLVAREPIAADLAPRGRRLLHEALAQRGVEVEEGLEVACIERGAVVTSRGEIPFDAAIVAAGFRASPLAQSAGLRVDARDRLLVDAHLASRARPEIRGAGDAAVCDVPVGAPMLMSCRVGMPAAAFVADDVARELAGARRRPFHIVDTGRCISVGRCDGVIEPHRGEGRTTNLAFSGRPAAWVKEQVCRFTMRWLAYERFLARLALGGSRTPRLAEGAA